MLIILERELLDITAALGKDGDKAVLLKTLDASRTGVREQL
jgi:hypothetical protein